VINCGRGFVSGDSFLAKITLTGAITVIGETQDATGTSLGMDGIAWGPQAVHPPGVPQFPVASIGPMALIAAALPILLVLRGRSAARLGK